MYGTMLRLPLASNYLHRTIRPLYGWTQATPASMLLDPAWARGTPIFPGMVAMKTTGDLVTLIDATGTPWGLFGTFVGGNGIDTLLDTGVNALGVWVLGPDAEFEILAPAFDTSQSWAELTTGVQSLVYAQTAGANRGKLVPAGTSGASVKPVARLAAVESATSIKISGLRAFDA